MLVSVKQKTRPKRSPRHPTRPPGVSHKAYHKVYWPYLPLLALFLVGMSFSTLSGHGAKALQRGHALAYATSMSRGGLLSSTNSERTANSVGALAINSSLNSAAQAKANDMAARNYWSHNTPEGNPPWIFVESEGYLYQKLGENLAAGFSDEASTIAGWMASPTHKANLLDGAFSEVGFGFANNANYVAGDQPMTVVVAFYGKPQVIPGPVTAPAATSNPIAPNPVGSPQTASPIPKPDQVVPATETVPVASPSKVVPVTTDSNSANAEPIRTTQAQLALRSTPFASIATGLALSAALAIGLLWTSRHALRLRRVIIQGESFVLHHPLLDIGLLVALAFLYLLTRTSGFIQ